MENNMNTENSEKEISLSVLWTVLKKCFAWVAIVAVVAAAAGGLFTKFFTKTEYKATASFWVNNNTKDYAYSSQAILSAASILAKNYMQLSTEDKVLTAAVRDGHLNELPGYNCSEDAAVARLRKMLKADRDDNDLFIFRLTVTADSPETAKASVESVKKVLPNIIQEMSNTKDADMIDKVYSLEENVRVTTVSPSYVRNAILAALVGAVITYCVFLLISVFDTVIHNETELTASAGCPNLGSVPHWSDPQETQGKRVKRYIPGKNNNGIIRSYKNMLVGTSTPFAINEAFNHIRTGVYYSAAKNGTPVYAVTSPFAGAGKSVVTSNIALSFAMSNKKVLLVDGDMRCPVLRKIFSLEKREGLSELLAGIIEDSHEVMQKAANNDNLTVISSGHIPPNPSELLSQPRMKELIDTWKSEFDIVLFDMPPVCEVTDAGVISQNISGYILVARCGYCDTAAVKSAVSFITSVDGSIIGTVLNDVEPKNTPAYVHGKKGYYKKYHYRYGYEANNISADVVIKKERAEDDEKQ